MSNHIPCPTSLKELTELLDTTQPLRLSAIKVMGKEKIQTFVYPPKHCFTYDERKNLIKDFWDSIKNQLNNKTTCVLRVHGNQLVLQLNF